MPKPRRTPARNNSFFDAWSLVHIATGVLLGWIMDPFIALAIMVLWEPFEVLVLSPILAKRNIIFGHESLKNSLSDVFFDVIGVAIGYYILTELIEPPLVLF